MPDNLAQRIADELTRRDIELLRLAAGDEARMAMAIQGLTDDLVARLARRDPTAVGRGAGQDRLERVIVDAQGIIRDRYREMYKGQRRRLIAVLMDELRIIPDAIASGLGVAKTVARRLMNGKVGPDVIRDIIDNRVISANATDAERLRGFFEREAASHHRRYTGALRQAFAQDETLSQMVKRLQDVSDIVAREANAVVRTGYNHAVNQLRVEMMGRNSHLFRGVICITKLDNRVSPICRSRSRGMWNLSNGQPLPDSPVQIKFPGPMPWHFGERSQLYPMTRAPREIGRMGDDEVADALNSLTDDQRTLLSPDPPDDEMYSQWLRRQSAEVQTEVLGPARRKLWLDGVDLGDMVTQKGRPLTLREIERRKARAS